MNIYVGNLSYDATDEQLQELFGQFGQVESASIVMDRATGRSRGFGFVEMPDAGEAQKAIDELNNKEINGRTLTVNQAKPRQPRTGGSSGGGGGGGYRGGGGGRGGSGGGGSRGGRGGGW
jgi:RNA recognition motif-containing protein